MGVADRKKREFQQREADILKVAFALFEKNGVERVTINMIADKLEIAKGTVYKHFKSKDEIFATFCHRFVSNMNKELKVVDKSQGVFEQLDYLTSTFMNYCLENVSSYRTYKECQEALNFNNLSPEVKNDLQTLYQEQADLIADVIRQGIEEKTLREASIPYLTCIGIGMLEGAMNTVLNSPLGIEIEDGKGFLSLAQSVLARGIKKWEST